MEYPEKYTEQEVNYIACNSFLNLQYDANSVIKRIQMHYALLLKNASISAVIVYTNLLHVEAMLKQRLFKFNK